MRGKLSFEQTNTKNTQQKRTNSHPKTQDAILNRCNKIREKKAVTRMHEGKKTLLFSYLFCKPPGKKAPQPTLWTHKTYTTHTKETFGRQKRQTAQPMRSKKKEQQQGSNRSAKGSSVVPPRFLHQFKRHISRPTEWRRPDQRRDIISSSI